MEHAARSRRGVGRSAPALQEAIDMMLALAAGDLWEDETADWFRVHVAAG